MNDLTALKERVVHLLAQALPDCEVLSAFPGQRPLPLSRPALAVSLDSVELSLSSLGGFSAPLSPQTPAAAHIVLRFDLYEPGAAATGIHSLWESLCASLLGQAASVGLVKLSCEPVARDESSRAWRLSAKASLCGSLTQGLSPSPAPAAGEVTHVTLQRRESDVS